MERRLTMVAAVLGFTGVALGAFGAHGLKGALEGLPDAAGRLAWWDTGSRYHLLHALAVLGTAVLAAQVKSPLPRIAAALFVTGVTLFSGSLYIMGATGFRGLALATPLGGVAFLVGWTLLALAARRLP